MCCASAASFSITDCFGRTGEELGSSALAVGGY